MEDDIIPHHRLRDTITKHNLVRVRFPTQEHAQAMYIVRSLSLTKSHAETCVYCRQALISWIESTYTHHRHEQCQPTCYSVYNYSQPIAMLQSGRPSVGSSNMTTTAGAPRNGRVWPITEHGTCNVWWGSSFSQNCSQPRGSSLDWSQASSSTLASRRPFCVFCVLSRHDTASQNVCRHEDPRALPARLAPDSPTRRLCQLALYCGPPAGRHLSVRTIRHLIRAVKASRQHRHHWPRRSRQGKLSACLHLQPPA